MGFPPSEWASTAPSTDRFTRKPNQNANCKKSKSLIVESDKYSIDCQNNFQSYIADRLRSMNASQSAIVGSMLGIGDVQETASSIRYSSTTGESNNYIAPENYASSSTGLANRALRTQNVKVKVFLQAQAINQYAVFVLFFVDHFFTKHYTPRDKSK
jgi:hypothetical protein